jgi:hypothetical protein
MATVAFGPRVTAGVMRHIEHGWRDAPQDAERFEFRLRLSHARARPIAAIIRDLDVLVSRCIALNPAAWLPISDGWNEAVWDDTSVLEIIGLTCQPTELCLAFSPRTFCDRRGLFGLIVGFLLRLGPTTADLRDDEPPTQPLLPRQRSFRSVAALEKAIVTSGLRKLTAAWVWDTPTIRVVLTDDFIDGN